MSTRSFGGRVPRNEDPRLLTGQALFVDDVQLPGLLHAAFVRSDLANARIRSLDLSAVRRHPGVVAAYSAEDLKDLCRPGPLLVPPPPIEGLEFHARTPTPLARERVRHVGEAIAVIVAESRYIAEDAAEAVELELESMDPVVDLESALAPDSPLVHEDLASNLAAHVIQEKGDYEAARARADRIIRRRFRYDRGVSGALENRGVVAWWDPHDGRLSVWDTTQAPIPVRNTLAATFGLSESQVRVIAPFILACGQCPSCQAGAQTTCATQIVPGNAPPSPWAVTSNGSTPTELNSASLSNRRPPSDDGLRR